MDNIEQSRDRVRVKQVFKPDAESVRIYKKKYELYLKLYEANKVLF